jgi:hypothetical protein
MSVRLRYELHEHGWADCTIEIGSSLVTVSASYLSDALESLAAAVVALLRGDESSTAIFTEEPGEFQWRFSRIAPDQLRVQIHWSMPRWNEQPHDPATPIFNATCRRRTFAGQVLSELQRLLRENGEEGYKQRWIEYSFPSKRLSQIESLLANDTDARVGA